VSDLSKKENIIVAVDSVLENTNLLDLANLKGNYSYDIR
jgi:hypothetical protein